MIFFDFQKIYINIFSHDRLFLAIRIFMINQIDFRYILFIHIFHDS